MQQTIKLVKDTITHAEVDALCDWLKTHPQLTKGKLTEEFETKWAEWLGVKHSVFVNSGSSANLILEEIVNAYNLHSKIHNSIRVD